MSIVVESPGAHTTVQDAGRKGLGASGVPPSGAMDGLSFLAANLLAGNEAGAAAFEITLAGPKLTFTEDHLVGIAGAPFEMTIEDEPVTTPGSFLVPRGASLSIGTTRVGLRCYLAVHGGLDVPLVLGSRATLHAARLGGVEGRPLAEGDVVHAGQLSKPAPRERRLRSGALPDLAREASVRAVPGPQTDAFTAPGIDAFFNTDHRVSPRSGRTGVRLQSAPIEHAGGADLDPEGVVTGAVQVPGDGMPIVLGPDGPATGGYVKIATVVAADLPLVAQARPGDTLRFEAVSVEDARAAWKERIRCLHEGMAEG